MSPAAVAATKRKPEPEAVPVPEVQEALARREAADIDRQDRLLKAYREAVTLAADGKPLPPAVADAAVEAAHALGLKASRLDADVAAMRRALACDRGERDFRAASPDRQARAQAVKREHAEAVQRLRALEAEAHRLSVAGYQLVAFIQERDGIERDFPHLFKAAADLDEDSWRHVRA